MRKPQDSDIFCTKSIGYAPRIVNQQKVDPNAEFQAKVNAQYDEYSRKIGSSHRGIYDEKVTQTKVNQNANFDENYHHTRKQADMQSTIFYESSLPNSRVYSQRPKITERIVPKHAYNMKDIQYNFGKKQTLERQMRKMPQNMTNFKGNSSNIFGYDQHVDRNGVKNKIQKLIPHQMQWSQHDSIRHQNFPVMQKQEQTTSKVADDDLSKSEVMSVNQINTKFQQLKIQPQKSKQNISSSINMMKKKPTQTNPEQKNKKQKGKAIVFKQAIEQKKSQKPVQITIMKGWSSNIMEQLSKYCKLNSTKIMSVNFEEGGKGNLTIDRSKRWQCITDWLRKDAKLKIRVMN